MSAYGLWSLVLINSAVFTFTAVVGAVWAWFYTRVARETRATPLEVTTVKSERAALAAVAGLWGSIYNRFAH